VRTPEEKAEAERVRAERAELRRQEVAAMRAVDPACEAEGDPPVMWKKPTRMGGDPSGVVLEIPRESGGGLPGSKLKVVERVYDGAGPNGGSAKTYATLFVAFHGSAGYQFRTVGVAVRREELREVAGALVKLADELDATKEG
jgi:hypothetical protein